DAGSSSSLTATASIAEALPDAPLPASASQSDSQAATPAPSTPADPQQTKRILGIMPNFRSVSADTKLPPQTVKEKFISAGQDTFDYSSFVLAAAQAGVSMYGKSYPEFHQGVVGY